MNKWGDKAELTQEYLLNLTNNYNNQLKFFPE